MEGSKAMPYSLSAQARVVSDVTAALLGIFETIKTKRYDDQYSVGFTAWLADDTSDYRITTWTRASVIEPVRLRYDDEEQEQPYLSRFLLCPIYSNTGHYMETPASVLWILMDCYNLYELSIEYIPSENRFHFKVERFDGEKYEGDLPIWQRIIQEKA